MRELGHSERHLALFLLSILSLITTNLHMFPILFLAPFKQLDLLMDRVGSMCLVKCQNSLFRMIFNVSLICLMTHIWHDLNEWRHLLLQVDWISPRGQAQSLSLYRVRTEKQGSSVSSMHIIHYITRPLLLLQDNHAYVKELTPKFNSCNTQSVLETTAMKP